MVRTMTSSPEGSASPHGTGASETESGAGTTRRRGAAPANEPARTVERRTVLAALGVGVGGLGLGATALSRAGTAAPLSGTSSRPAEPPACMLAPEALEGPFFVDENLLRSDITENREGLPLELRIRIMHGVECTPIAGADVDIWHCDAGGWYSGHLDISPDVPPTAIEYLEPTDPSRFLRGLQVTDRHGDARFRTIYPGWYWGRAIHIHAKVHVEGTEVHTGQFYFPEEINRQVALLEPYVGHTATRRIPNEEDSVYQQQNGQQSIVKVRPMRANRPSFGYLASITAGVIPGQTPPEPPYVPPTTGPS